MPVPFEALREDHAEILALVDEQPASFDFAVFARAVARKLGRHLVVMPYDPAVLDDGVDLAAESARSSGGCSPFTGFYSRVEDPHRPGLIRDVIGYASHESIPRTVQDSYMAHELGHMVLHHARHPNEQDEQERLAQVFAPTLLAWGGRDAIRHIMGRSALRTDEEERAEGIALLVRERLATRPTRQTQDGLLANIAQPLSDPGWHRRGSAKRRSGGIGPSMLDAFRRRRGG
ncbi:MAG TPA: ImmA/IrrE family metallo-endopeptidase [Nonomuraea sp.]|nr:ImmA/IrrE family metallo-endopeptidase [Nonomuraea sp.]